MFTTISTVNNFMGKPSKPYVAPPTSKYPIHSIAVLSSNGGSFSTTTNSGGFVQYTNLNSSSYLNLNSLGSNNSYFDTKSFTMYYAFKVNTYSANAGILGFFNTFATNNGYLFHIIMQSSTTCAFDWQDNNIEYGTNTGANQNYPTFAYVVGSIYHMFFTFDKPTQKYNIKMFNNAGTSVFTFLDKPYPTNVFSSNAGAGKAFTKFTVGNNTYATGYAALQTVVFFNFFEKVLSDTEIGLMIADST